MVHAQAPPARRRDVPPPLIEERPSKPPSPGLVLPPLPPPSAIEPSQLPLVRVFVRKIQVIGSTVFSTDELAKVTAPYENRELTSEDLEELRLALTLQYTERGYINSGAIIPDQDVTEGVITIRIIEGELTTIDVEGNKWFRDSYIRERLALGAGPPLNIYSLQERLQLLLQDRRLEQLNAELEPGVELGESVLVAEVQDRHPFRVLLGFDNYAPPSVGAEQPLVRVAHENVTGHGDILSVQYQRTEGINPLLFVDYTLPFTARDTTLILSYQNEAFRIVEEPFEPLDIEGDSEIFGFTLRQPFYRTLNQEFAVALTGELISSETFLLGRPFSFNPGAQNGEADITALRPALEWVHRSQTQVFAARSRFSLGIDAFGATINDDSSVPDGKFFAWLGQFQWARRWGVWDSETLFRTSLQLANDPLFPLEQIQVGGRYTVRGYRENQLVRDNAYLSSLEVRIPVARDKPWAEFLQIVPFADFGRAWNTGRPTPDPKNLASIGLGLRWAVTVDSRIPVRPEFEIYWGHPLVDVDTVGGDLQDAGVHFQFLVGSF